MDSCVQRRLPEERCLVHPVKAAAHQQIGALGPTPEFHLDEQYSRRASPRLGRGRPEQFEGSRRGCLARTKEEVTSASPAKTSGTTIRQRAFSGALMKSVPGSSLIGPGNVYRTTYANNIRKPNRCPTGQSC